MPSPFPGMAPYLEGSLWTTFHFAFGAEIIRQLAPRPRYLALPVERLVREELGDIGVTTSIEPDVGVITAQPTLPLQLSGQALAAPLQLVTIIPQAVPHVSIEIRDVAQCQLVAAIEILSPTNKRGDGRSEYLTKRRRILTSSAHLIELDLLRLGQRVPMQQELPDAPYFVLLSRVEQRPIVDVWPVELTMPLPGVPIPLLSGDADVPLDLQATFTATYDLLGYDLLLDYTQGPDIPLSASLARQAAELI